MAKNVELPSPWVQVYEYLPDEKVQLEKFFGSELTDSELDNENDRYPDGAPRSRRAWFYSGADWVRIRNTESGLEVVLRLQTYGDGQMDISALAVPFSAARPEIVGSDLRSIPVGAIADAYAYNEAVGRANLQTFLATMQEVTDIPAPMEPLPKASKSAKFSALAARQYRHIEDNEPGAYVAQRMSEINSRPLATVQGWITQARKAGFLPPARTGRRPNA